MSASVLTPASKSRLAERVTRTDADQSRVAVLRNQRLVISPRQVCCIRARRISAVLGRNTSMLLSTRIVISSRSTALSAAGVSDEPPSVLFHNHSSITQIFHIYHGPKKASGGTE